MSRRLLLSGFEPFGDFATNPSWDALELAQSEGLLRDGVKLVRIPVTYTDAFRVFEQAVTEHDPEAAISFGVYGSKLDSPSFREANGAAGLPATLFIETIARNRDGAPKPDNAGVTRGGDEIVAGAPPELPATFPAMAMQRSLKEAGFEAGLSEDAGAYLCNHLFYRASHAYFERFPYGFVHVPPVDTMGGKLSLRQLANAMAILANTFVRHLGS
ncbi:MAG: pyroglutamyl-peptidase I [Planctomycetes bacterium]|nr:pyroglutamyl-peptidase I [Planctomycetota bacterium]